MDVPTVLQKAFQRAVSSAALKVALKVGYSELRPVGHWVYWMAAKKVDETVSL
jgi:hypothetical protein